MIKINTHKVAEPKADQLVDVCPLIIMLNVRLIKSNVSDH